jgi:Ras-related protein Rab-5C
MVGAATVGKTSLAAAFARGYFLSNPSPTLGTVCRTVVVPTPHYSVRLQIWDTAGCEKYRSVAPIYFHGADGAIIVYDISSPASFEDVGGWLSDLRQTSDREIPAALVGNKSDLELRRMVSTQAGMRYAEQHGMKFFKETSAVTGDNVRDVFVNIVQFMELDDVEVGDVVQSHGNDRCC